MDDNKLRSLLSKTNAPVDAEDTSTVPVDTPITSIPQSIDIATSAIGVMTAYQNANRWLDIIKESILMDYGCVYFSNYVHNLAHTMPTRFDKFGDILHTVNIRVPYPPTGEFPASLPDFVSIFSNIFIILDTIQLALKQFISTTEHTPLALSAEELLVDISKEYTHLYRMQKVQSITASLLEFDMWVHSYVENLNQLLDR